MTNNAKPATVADILLSDIKVSNTRRRFGDVAGLAESIAEIGLLNPLVISEDGTLIAGLRRLEAVRSLGWTSVPVSIVSLGDVDREIAEIDENLIRGNLSTAEAAPLWAQRKALYQQKHPETRVGASPGAGRGRGSKRLQDGGIPPTSKRFDQDAAEKTGKAARTVRELTQIGESVDPEVLETVIEHAPALANNTSQLIELARMEPEKQREVAAKLEAGVAVDLKDAKRKLKEDRREAVRQENRRLVEETAPVESDTYQTIVIDPPWDWGDEGDQDQLGRARPTYATLSLEELLALPVGELADANAHIYLWITNRSLPKGFALLERWGFRYVTCVTWGKPSFGMGNYFRGQTEQILFGVRGSLPLLRKDVGTLLLAPRGDGGHSSKPDAFYELVESCSPGPWLEMFARGTRPGWAGWGAEA